MPYFCYCKDCPDASELRRKHTAEHLHYIETIVDRILIAGPLIEAGAGSYNASCFIYKTDNREEALELLHNDPYFIAGIYAEIQCQEFLPAAGTWVGGKTW